MARRQKQPSHENHERWLVSYADFITLMFAFFVVMFASSQADKGRARQVSESVRKALEEGKFASAIMATLLGGAVDEKGKGNAQMRGPGGAQKASQEAKEDKWKDLAPSLEILSAELKPEIQAGQLEIRLETRGLVLSLKQAAFFPSGEDTIASEMYPSLKKIAAAIEKLPNPVRLEGHTDAVPIHNARFRSNWDLSAARSIAMLDLLSGRFGVQREKLSVAGYAENVPVGSNDTEQGRARNRRVDIVILSKDGMKVEPKGG